MRGPLIVFGAALAVRLLFIAQARHGLFFDCRGLEAVDSPQRAPGPGSGAWPGALRRARPPLYPVFLAVLYELAGRSVLVVRVAQAVLGSLTCALVFLIGRRLFADRAAAWLAAGIGSFYGTLIYFDGALLPASLETVLQTALLYALMLAMERPADARRWLLPGVLIALSTLNRGGTLIMLPIAAALLGFAWRRGSPSSGRTETSRSAPGAEGANDVVHSAPDTGNEVVAGAGGIGEADGIAGASEVADVDRVREAPSSSGPSRRSGAGRSGFLRPVAWHLSLAALAAPTLLAVGLTSIHNAAHDATSAGRAAGMGGWGIRSLLDGRFLPIAANSGINFLLGNDPALEALNDTNHPDHFMAYDALLTEARRAEPYSVARQDQYLFRLGRNRLLASPAAAARLWARKALLLVNGTEIARNANLYAERRDSWLLRLALWRRLIGFPTGVVLPLAFIGLVATRSEWRRLLPLYAIMGTQAAFILAFFVTDRYRAPLLPMASLLAAAGILDLRRRWGGRGSAAGRRQLLRALAILAGALIVCNLPIAPYHAERGAYEIKYLADDRLGRGDLEGAIGCAREAVRVQHDSAPAHHALGTLLRRKFAASGEPGAAAEAIAEFREALRLHPEYDEAWAGIGLTCLATGDLGEAEEAMERAVALSPATAVWQLDLGAVRARQGRYEDAVACYREALRIDPEFAPAHVSIGGVREFQGREADAAEAYAAALRLDPDNADARARLARVRARMEAR